jgi:predicted ester cyclase
MITGLRAAFPDLAIREEALIAEGDLVAARWVASGTHSGAPFAGMEPSGRRFEIAGMSFYRVRAGRIVEGWVCDDTLGMLTQLGALPAAPAAE